MAAMVVAPPAPPFPPELQGQPVVVMGACYHGGLAEGEEALPPVREFGLPAVDMLEPIPYVALQQMVDAFTPRGLPYYVKSEWLGDLPDAVIDGLVEHHLSRTSPLHQILIHQMGGAVARVPVDATAFAYRNSPFVITVSGALEPAEERERHVEWVRSTWEASLPRSLGGAYVNHLDADEGDARVRDAYRPATYDRLSYAAPILSRTLKGHRLEEA